MRPTKTLWLVTLLAFPLWNCQGPEGIPGPVGPPGAPGPRGPAGSTTVALMYELEFDLKAANQWEAFYRFPPADKIYPEDVVLVYLLWDQVEVDGKLRDVWRLMPVNFLSPDGTLSLNYDFTVTDVRLFAEATFPLDPRKDVFERELARIVVVPADYSANGRKNNAINYQDYEQVKAAFNLPDRSTHPGNPPRKTRGTYRSNSW